MYFWRIENLKAEMATRPLSEREALPYLIAFVALSSAVIYLPLPMTTLWDQLAAAWSVLLAVAGTIYIYHQNGGASGHHFLQRYFAIGWVVSVRWFFLIIPPGIVFYALLKGDTEDTTWDEFLFFAVAEALLYWRIGHHVGDLANKTKAAA